MQVDLFKSDRNLFIFLNKGFELSKMNYFLDGEESAITKYVDIILVKKIDEREKVSKSKKALKRLDIEGINDNNIHKKTTHQEEKEKEFEEFAEEMEETEIIDVKPSEEVKMHEEVDISKEKNEEKPKVNEKKPHVEGSKEKKKNKTKEKEKPVEEKKKSSESEEK